MTCTSSIQPWKPRGFRAFWRRSAGTHSASPLGCTTGAPLGGHGSAGTEVVHVDRRPGGFEKPEWPEWAESWRIWWIWWIWMICVFQRWSWNILLHEFTWIYAIIASAKTTLWLWSAQWLGSSPWAVQHERARLARSANHQHDMIYKVLQGDNQLEPVVVIGVIPAESRREQKTAAAFMHFDSNLWGGCSSPHWHGRKSWGQPTSCQGIEKIDNTCGMYCNQGRLSRVFLFACRKIYKAGASQDRLCPRRRLPTMQAP